MFVEVEVVVQVVLNVALSGSQEVVLVSWEEVKVVDLVGLRSPVVVDVLGRSEASELFVASVTV